MKRSGRLLFASAALALFGNVIVPTTDRPFWGEITDSLCAQSGSHETTANGIKTSRECTIGCVKGGARYVLYNAHRRVAFQLDNQRKPQEFAGEKVMVIGTYDSKTNTIHVKDIQPVYKDTIKTGN